jgi:hypothetical protein
MTQAEAIEAAHANTGRRAENIGIDANFHLLAAIQEICGRARWPWRKKSLSFSSTAGTATYDLTSASVADIDDFSELISIYRFDTTTSFQGLDILDTDEKILAAIGDTGTTDDPSAYCNEPGGAECTIRLSPIPNATKTYRGLYWAIPSVLDSGSGTIPLIPARWHFVLVKHLEKRFLSALPDGQGTAEAALRAQEAENGVQLMLLQTKFSTRDRREFTPDVPAVRST